MRLINVEKRRLEEFVGEGIPPYAILSHTWGANEDEILFEDIEQGNINKSGPQLFKFEESCKQALQDGLKYAWIDTCCIPRSDFTELGEAINSMFRWYKNAAVCYAYLADVPIGVDCSDPNSKFFTSRWFTRGWTLQELLAPKEVRFYDAAWNFLGTKADMSIAIETITGIPRPVLQGWASLDTQSVAQRMSWASKRVTKRPEDIAYCLLGLFGVYLNMIYGEGAEEAFSRLQQKIMTEVRDDSILAWGLTTRKSAPRGLKAVLSAGALARSPSDFANCRRIRSRQRYTGPMHSLEISGGCLSVKLQLHKEKNGDVYGVLNCGPDDADDDVVVIPLHAVSSESSEYIRPKNHVVRTRNKKSLEGPHELIYIRKDQASGGGKLENRQHWFYIEESIESNLELIDVRPSDRWQKNHGMIVTTNKCEGDISELSLTRFRSKMSGCSDVVVILQFELAGGRPSARCHVMICSRDTDMDELGSMLPFMRENAVGKQGASNGRFKVKATVTERSVAGQQMFVLRLATVEILSEPTVDATREISQVNAVLGFIKTLQQERAISGEEIALYEKQSELTAELQRRKQWSIVVEENIRKLINEKEVLQKAIQGVDSALAQNEVMVTKVKEDKDKFNNLKLGYRTQLRDLLEKDLDTHSGPGQWVEEVALVLVRDFLYSDPDSYAVARRNPSSDQNGTKASQNIDDDHRQVRVPLDERESIFKLLQAESVSVVPEDWKGTPLGWMAANGLRSVLLLHLLAQQLHLLVQEERQIPTGSKRDFSYKDMKESIPSASSPFPRGRLTSREFDEADESGRTPLSYAAGGGHMGIVEMLLDAGAFIDSEDRDFRTPLVYAAMSGHNDMVNLLVTRGATTERWSPGKVVDSPKRADAPKTGDAMKQVTNNTLKQSDKPKMVNPSKMVVPARPVDQGRQVAPARQVASSMPID